MKKIIIALIGCMIMSGCSVDVLDLNNPAQFNENSYFKTQKECQEVIAACYSTFTMKPFWARDWYFIMDLLSGHTMSTANMAGDPDFFNMENLVYTPNNPWIQSIWKGFYRMSQRGLVAVDKLTAWETNGADEAAYKEKMIGEAWFFHGFAYYFLTELYGDVPYHPSWVSIKEEPVKGRTPYEEVQQEIETAFLTALSMLPETWDDNFLGRITKDAARAMLGKLYLTMGDNDKAIQYFESLRANSYHPDYEALFTTGNHTSPEIILQVLHKFWGWDQGNSYHMFDGKETWGDKATNTGRAMEYGFNDWNNTSISNMAANKFEYMLNGSEYIDPRNQFVMYGDGTLGDDDYVEGTFPYIPYIPFDPDNLDDEQEVSTSSNSGYKWKKWCRYETHAHMDVDMGDYSSILIRLADVKLLLAEAYIAKGNYDKAKSLINEVRTRDAVQAEPYSDLNAGNAFEILSRERYIELFGELHYWLDMVRWDRLGKMNMITELGAMRNKTVDPKYKKFPIPIQEKETNPNMKLPGAVKDGWN